MPTKQRGAKPIPIPVVTLLDMEARGLKWEEQAATLKVSASTLARWWRAIRAEREAKRDPRGLSAPPTTPSAAAGPPLAIFSDPEIAGIDPADLTPAQRRRRFLRRIAITESEGGPDALRAVMSDMSELAKQKAEESYAATITAIQHEALKAACQRLAAYLQQRTDPIAEARRYTEAKPKDAPTDPDERKIWDEARRQARAYIAAHPEDDELERLYRASSSATGSDEDRDAFAAWIDGHRELVDGVIAA